jgi:hypothetical protein
VPDGDTLLVRLFLINYFFVMYSDGLDFIRKSSDSNFFFAVDVIFTEAGKASISPSSISSIAEHSDYLFILWLGLSFINYPVLESTGFLELTFLY